MYLHFVYRMYHTYHKYFERRERRTQNRAAKRHQAQSASSTAVAANVAASGRTDLRSKLALFHQGQHVAKGQVFCRAQPFEGHHLGRHQLGPVARKPVKGGVAVALAA